MKKLSVFVLAMLMALGVSGVASAAITFDIDFYGSGDLEKGVMDTGQVIDLNVCETVSVDLWVRGIPIGNGVGGFGFGFGVLPDAEINFEVTGYELDYPILDSGRSEIIPRGLAVEALLWPPGTKWDGDFLMATLELHCTKPSFDELWIYDYWPDSAQWVLADGTVMDGKILPQHLADINQVPIPGAVWLLGSGLIGLVGLRRKIRS